MNFPIFRQGLGKKGYRSYIRKERNKKYKAKDEVLILIIFQCTFVYKTLHNTPFFLDLAKKYVKKLCLPCLRELVHIKKNLWVTENGVL